MKKKVLLSTVLVAAMVTGMLTGCGDTPANNDSSVSDQPVSSQPSEQPSDSSEEGSEVSDAGSGNEGGSADWTSLLEIDTLENPNVVLDHYWNPDGRDSFEMAAIQRYEEKYGAGTVTVNTIGWNGGITALQSELASNEVCDLIFTE